MTFDPNTHHVLMIPFANIKTIFYIAVIHNFGYLIDKHAKIYRI